jgi:RNA 2',3'-cyclic 3'-phosphodiesterase
MRLFVAVLVPDEIRGKGAQIAKEMITEGLPVRPVAAQNMHMTLAFLGDVAEDKVTAVKNALASVEFGEFTVEIAGFGAFPSLSRPNAIWLGCESVELSALAAKVDAALVPLGFANEKFSGHLTIGRAKARCDLRNFAEKYAKADFGVFEASSFALVESRLGSGGPSYQTHGEFGARRG